MKKIRIGVFGVKRGSAFFDSILQCDGDLVAICDGDPVALAEAKKKVGDNVVAYDKFEDFFNHPMDAVFLANYFNEHAQYAVRYLEKGIHVLSECTAAATMADCVALVRAAEKSTAKYMLAENYPFMKFNRELKRICDGGTLGRILYAEGEYNHPVSGADTSFFKSAYPFPNHWRNYLPAAYYITHSLAPLMYATGANPRRVTAMPVYGPRDEARYPASGKHCSDCAAIITTLNDDRSVFKFTGCAAFGAHGNSYRVCGENGQFENQRGHGFKVMLRYNKWNLPEGMQTENFYEPEWHHPKQALIEKSGHAGGDFQVIDEFFNSIREDKKTPFDVYFATRMSAVAILAHRSLLQEGVPFDVPDFRKEEDRLKWENDRETPFYDTFGGTPTISASSDPDYRPTDAQMEAFKNIIK